VICSLDARRHGGPSPAVVSPILALSIVALAYAAADPAPGVGLLAELAAVPLLVATSSLTAVWSWWHFAVVAVSQTCLSFVHAVGSLAHPWLILLLSGCVILVADRAGEPPQ